MEKLNKLGTEQRNSNSMKLDRMKTSEILTLINREDQSVADKVKEVLPQITQATELVVDSLKADGRVIYIGAGTSGRLGFQDAVECMPTFSMSHNQVMALIAGGTKAFEKAVEGAEDQKEVGEKDLREINLTFNDVVIGIAASGRTPYVIGALQYAGKVGAKRIALSSNLNSEISLYSESAIEVLTGPEVLTGSTRMKAATAHKMILNMISTTAMIQIGKVYENLMIDLKVTNYKLKQRAISILRSISDISMEASKDILEKTNYRIKPAIVILKTGTSLDKALATLESNEGLVDQAIEEILKQ